MSIMNEKDLGQVLQAEYHYVYKTINGDVISIEVGEEFILIKKSNNDWWQVIKEDQKKPFYVPAAYMKKLQRQVFPDHTYFKKAYSSMQKQKKKLQLSQSPNQYSEKQSINFRYDQNQNVGSRENLSQLSSKSKFSNLRASIDSLDRFIENENPYDEVPFESKFSQFQPTTEHKRRSNENFFEEPEYENLEIIQKKISESHLSPTKSENKAAHNEPQPIISVVEESGVGMDVNEDYESKKSLQRRMSFDPISSPTSTEIPEGERVIKLDNNVTLPGHDIESTQLHPEITELDDEKFLQYAMVETSVARIVPPAVPDVSMKPTLQRSNLSPEPDTASMTSEQRRASPVRSDRRSSLPNVVDVGPSLLSKRDKPLAPLLTVKESSKSGVDRNQSFRERFFRESSRKKNKNKHKKTNSDATILLAERTTLQSGDDRLQALPGWIKERSSEGEVTFVRKSNGDRWQQMYDSQSENHYYFNELTQQTSWDLPELDLHEEVASLSIAERKRPDDDDLLLIEKSSEPRDVRVRKASTIERDTVPGFEKNDLAPAQANTLPKNSLPPVAVKPRKSPGLKKQAERVILAQSMFLPSTSEHFQQLNRGHGGRESHFGPIPHPMIKRQGRLYWTKLMEAGKKQRKHWIQQWVVLLANNLLFYKDEKQAQTTKALPHGKPESSCDLRGASVEWAHEKSSKKNVIELQTVRGLSLLLQHDDQTTIQKWLTAIQDTIQIANQADDFVPSKAMVIEEEDDNDSKKKKEKKKSKKPTRQNSDAKYSDNVRTRLKKFISRRPTLESLQERGIIKETVFGCPLAKLCEKERTTIPNFVKLCVEEVEKRGLDVDGIYRVSGNLSHVQKLRYLIDQSENVDLSEVQWDDIHLVTGALKMFLRELPEPVIPFDFFDNFIAACKIKDDNSRVSAMKGLVDVLPQVNGDTLRYLMKHFRNVVEHSSKNRMQVQNIAIVFGPTLLLKPPEETKPDPTGSSHMAVYMVYQNQIIDEMLMQYNRIFG